MQRERDELEEAIEHLSVQLGAVAVALNEALATAAGEHMQFVLLATGRDGMLHYVSNAGPERGKEICANMLAHWEVVTSTTPPHYPLQ